MPRRPDVPQPQYISRPPRFMRAYMRSMAAAICGQTFSTASATFLSSLLMRLTISAVVRRSISRLRGLRRSVASFVISAVFLGTSGRHALKEVLLQREEKDEHRQSGERCPCHHGSEQSLVGKFEGLQPDLNGVHIILARDKERPEEGVPCGKERVYRHDREHSL